ncbi:MAG: cupin domain-containing protein [Oscillospiraceae bacterium]|jgi:quercetin dioxygenase-like cupin family protein|nr:cupin domain-containing protein [Oscillospiraceae bacterium]
MPVIHEKDIEEKSLPGRAMRWLVTPEKDASKYTSMCVIRVPVGGTVRPAHAHPNGEEIIYIVSGHGRVVIDGKVDDVYEGTAVLFPQNSVHMTQNTGDTEMKVACFFAPPSDISTYKFFEDVDFPD